jgi:hypothetical protein
MSNEQDVVIAFCWFDGEQWKLFAEIDPNGVDDSYEEWRKMLVALFQKSGQAVKR